MSTAALPARRPDVLRTSTSSPRRPWRDGPILKKGLPAERERQLALAIQAGDNEARNELVEGNLALAELVARRYAQYECPGIDLDDLVQEGRLGLIRAAEKFDPVTHGTRFSTYAVHWIKQRLTRALHNQARAIRIPEYLFQIGEAAQHEHWFQPITREIADDDKGPLDRMIEAEEWERFNNLIPDLSGADCLVLWTFLFATHRRQWVDSRGRRCKGYAVNRFNVEELLERLRIQAEQQEGADG